MLDGAKAFPIVLAEGLGERLDDAGREERLRGGCGSGRDDAEDRPRDDAVDPADITAANVDDQAAAANGLSTWVNLSTVATATAGSAGDLLLQQVVGSLKADPGSGAIALWKGVDEPFWSGNTAGQLQFA